MQATRIPVRHRRTLVDADRMRVTLTVFCPLRGESVDVARCKECGHSDGTVVRNAKGAAPTILCRAGGATLRYDEAPDLLSAELTPVFELMSPDVMCVEPDTAADLALRCLLDADVAGAPVVDPTGRLLAYVSKDDLSRALLEQNLDGALEHEAGSFRSIGSSPGFHLESLPTTIEQVQTPIVRAIPESSSVGRAAAYMALHRVHQLVVVSSRAEVVGLLTALDLVAWLAHECGYNVRACPTCAPPAV
jgi:CBS domain-containing protein